ncbi:hypothetical protein [Methylobacterium sp. J-077]|uniref:hypothetical protein n=1 Tax=Methylobacterium sp. J-077 TaxID=2836656 RepID=UPI001FB8B419|nr:hypothetical protein [Methylobacterium sp. J-077]MCJ2121016.1 hypothetical protein [Methylobacterium sp. J-077]
MNHAVPLVLRSPTQRLAHARQDHATCLVLAASYRARLICADGDATDLRERHAWAIDHARTLRARFPGVLSAPRA